MWPNGKTMQSGTIDSLLVTNRVNIEIKTPFTNMFNKEIVECKRYIMS